MTEIILESNTPVENMAEPPAEPPTSKPSAIIKTPPTFSRAETITAALMLPLGYLYIKLILAPIGYGLGVTLFTLLFIGAVLYWQRGQQLAHSRDSLIYLGLIMLTAAYFPLFDNSTLKGLALLLLHLLVGYYTATISGIRMERRLGSYLPFDLLDSLVLRPLSNLFHGPRAVVAGSKNAKTMHSLLLLLLGLVLAIPLCLAVSYMLQEADAAFSALWHRFTSIVVVDTITVNIMQLVVSLPLACYFFGLLYGGKGGPRKKEKVDHFAQKVRFVPGLLAIGGITPLLLIYAVFFCSQTAYFLSAFSGLLPEGYIYSDYARRGFFELCRVSSLNFIIILALQLLCKKDAGKGFIYRLYTVALSLCSIALVVISLRKMLLYIQIFGLTPLRVYTSWFMVLLALVFIFIIVKTYRSGFNVLKWSSIITVGMFLLLCFANPDAIIARYNMRGYEEGRLAELDVYSFMELGSAATPYLLEIANSEQTSGGDRDTAKMLLNDSLRRAELTDWRSFNLTEWRGETLLRDSTW